MVLSVEAVVGELGDVRAVVGDTGRLKLLEDVGDVMDSVACYPFSVGAAELVVGKFPRLEVRGECIGNGAGRTGFW